MPLKTQQLIQKVLVFCENYQDLFVEQPLQKNHHLGK